MKIKGYSLVNFLAPGALRAPPGGRSPRHRPPPEGGGGGLRPPACGGPQGGRGPSFWPRTRPAPRAPELQHCDKTGGKNPNAKSYKVTNINTGEFVRKSAIGAFAVIYPTFKEAYESVKGSKSGAYKAFGRERGRRQGRQK